MNYKLLRLLFHIGFICVYQHILLLALVFPALIASKVSFLFLCPWFLIRKAIWYVSSGAVPGKAGKAAALPRF